MFVKGSSVHIIHVVNRINSAPRSGFNSLSHRDYEWIDRVQ